MSRSAWRPTAEQAALLRACLAPDDQLEARVRAWEALVPLDDIDHGSFRLVPFLYRRLERAGVQARDHGRIKGIYARHWYLYHRETEPALDLLARIREEGVDLLLLKGAALRSIAYRDDPPSRPADDVDVLVRASDVGPLIDVLVGHGFRQVSDYSLPYALRYRKSLGLSGPLGSIDLNWRLHEFRRDGGLEDRVRQGAVEVDVRGRSFRSPSPTYHLLQALVHGSAWNAVPGIRWILDAGLLVNLPGAVDWRLFRAEVRRCGWRAPVLDQLRLLRDGFGVAVPPSGIVEVERMPISVPGTLMDLALTRSTRTGRRAARVAFGEYLCSAELPAGWRAAAHYPLGNARTLTDMSAEWKREREAPAVPQDQYT